MGESSFGRYSEVSIVAARTPIDGVVRGVKVRRLEVDRKAAAE